MFKKPIKIKSNTQVKGSEKKIVKEKLLNSFPNLTESQLEDLLPKKDVITQIKICTSCEELVHVYMVQRRPIVFEVRGAFFPTIYLLWQFPNLLHSYTTHPTVLSYLSSGADLMLPGVLIPPDIKYGNLQEGNAAYVNTSQNQAAFAVGVTAQSSFDMLKSQGRGKCLILYHMYGDRLCNLDGIQILQFPNLLPPDWIKLQSYEEDFPQLGAKKSVSNNVEIIESENNEESVVEAETDSIDTVDEMDKLLTYCFFVAIKYSKTLTLPILTSNFFKVQMLSVCPEGKTLDIKKTSFKKLKPFLDYHAKEGLITVKEVKKGVESITAINKEHPKFTEFYVEPSLRPRKDNINGSVSTNVTEAYIITPNVLPIFRDSGLNKGDTIQIAQIRHHVTEYVKKNECQNEENKRLIKPKEALVKICKTENFITWEELMEKVCESMKSCYKVSSGNEELMNKGKVSPITISVSQRSGNKKVTLVDNLELFGVKIAEFAKECQHGVAASTSISRPQGKKCDQLLVQGNQVIFVFNLLTEKYKIPARYIRGLENAPKKKK